MFKFVKHKVSGERIRMVTDKYDLDLSYITPRIIAMSFPAANFWQKIYRNNILDVSNYMEEHHRSTYWVYNMSGIAYDTGPFNDQVLTAKWEDHHSPTLDLLMECC